MLFLFDAQSGGNLLKKLEISQNPVNRPQLQYKIEVCHFHFLLFDKASWFTQKIYIYREIINSHFLKIISTRSLHDAAAFYSISIADNQEE